MTNQTQARSEGSRHFHGGQGTTPRTVPRAGWFLLRIGIDADDWNHCQANAGLDSRETIGSMLPIEIRSIVLRAGELRAVRTYGDDTDEGECELQALIHLSAREQIIADIYAIREPAEDRFTFAPIPYLR